MGVQTAFRLFSIPAAFSVIALLTAFLTKDIRGWYALLAGLAVGVLAAKLHTPSLLERWARTGMPGDQKTPEQQKRWQQEKDKAQIRKNVGIVIVGVLGAAILRTYFREISPIILPVFPAGAATYILCVGWLIYRKRGKLGP